jgi:7-carboxy-7-deazaguanine synthase
MGKKGTAIKNHRTRPLDCAGKAQRGRRFSARLDLGKARRKSYQPSFSYHHNRLIINTHRAGSCPIVVAGGRPDSNPTRLKNRSAGLRPGANTPSTSPPEKSYPPTPNSAYCAPVSETLNVNEIYLSLQGESTFAGLPCIFVRLTACNLRCSYCDSAYAFTEGKKQSLADIRTEIDRLAKPFSNSSHVTHHTSLPLVELTGGEPLLQKNALPLMAQLCDDGYTVLLETSGAHDISAVDPRVRRIMDLKCPSSGEVERNRWENLAHLKNTDEIKFVIGTVEDYAWVKDQIGRHKLASVSPVLISWVHPLAPEQQDKSLKKVPAGQIPITRLDLVERIIADALPVRFQAQLHKIIWPPEQRGV